MNTEVILKTIVQQDKRGALEFSLLDPEGKKVVLQVAVVFDHPAAVCGFIQGKKYAIAISEVMEGNG